MANMIVGLYFWRGVNIMKAFKYNIINTVGPTCFINDNQSRPAY